MQKRTSLLIATVLTLAVGAALIPACRGHQGRDHDPKKAHKFLSWWVDDALDQLEATDDQRTKIHGVKDQIFNEGMAFKEISEKHKEALIAQWAQEAPDAAQMHAEVDLWAAEVQELGHKMVDSSLEIHDTLTTEQRVELLKILADHMEK